MLSRAPRSNVRYSRRLLTVCIVDVRFINPFMGGIKSVFATMLNTEIVISKPRLRVRDEQNADVSAIIGFSGEAAGSVALCFPVRTAVSTASKFAGVTITPDHPDFGDALGELANMVAGQAKSKLEGSNITISLPRVIAGTGLKLLDSQSAPILILPCDSELGRFATEVSMVLAKKGSPRPAAATA